MFERYSEDARRAVFFARDEAMRYGSTRIESEHLLLSILRADQDLNARLWAEHGGIDSVRKRIDAAAVRGTPISGPVEMPLSEESKRILNRSVEEADDRRQRQITAGHLLLAILETKESLAARILEAHGITRVKIREAFTA